MSDQPTPVTVFFDLAQTLGYECQPTGSDAVSFRRYDDIPPRLAELRSDGHRIGVLASGPRWTTSRIREALRTSALDQLIERELTAEWTGDTSAFEGALGGDTSARLLVSPSTRRRRQAARAGLMAVPHPALARSVARGDRVIVLRATGPRLGFEQLFELCHTQPFAIPLRILPSRDAITLYVMTTHSGDAGERTVLGGVVGERLRRARLDVTAIGDQLAMEAAELHWLDLDHLDERKTSSDGAVPRGFTLLHRDDGFAVAVASESEPPEPATMGCCGGSAHLEPRFALLRESRPARTFSTFPLDEADADAISQLTVEEYRAYLDPWWDGRPSAPYGAIRSRDARHPHNARAAAAAADLLRTICGAQNVRTPPFATDIRPDIYNVEATIPADPASELAGEVVLLGAHLDSINGEVDLYAHQDAPGADDDASGMAAIFSAASVLTALSRQRQPRRTIRLVLFNAEEHSLLGSMRYADDHADDVVAMFQVDMIGFVHPDSPTPRQWEVHTGTRPGVRDPDERRRQQELLGDIVEKAAQRLAPDLRLQRYPIAPGCADPGSRGSDHASFDCPSCKICENFYTDVCGGGRHPHHPTYHSPRDTCIDYEFATRITRATIGAVWMRANAT